VLPLLLPPPPPPPPLLRLRLLLLRLRLLSGVRRGGAGLGAGLDARLKETTLLLAPRGTG
jgi:hypothetical protein